MGARNTVTLGGLPAYDDHDRPLANSFRVGTGATRPGEGTVLMLSSDYQQLVSNTAGAGTLLGGVFPLVMTGSPGPGLTLQVVVCGAQLASTGNGNSPDMMLVAIKDLRAVKPAIKTPDKLHYNCMMPGFVWKTSSTTYSCYPSTLKSNVPYTWAQIATALQIPDIPSAPTWTPYNVSFDGTDAAKIIDDIARRLYLVAGFDPTASPAAGSSPLKNATYYAPGTWSSTNSSLRAQADGALIDGGVGSINNLRLPSTFYVIFQGQNNDSTDPFLNRFYSSQQSVGSYGGGTEYLHCGDMFAVRTSSAWVNQSICDTIAKDLAARAIAFRSQVPQVETFAGIWPFTPDGAIRRIEFSNGPNGATTTIFINNEVDWDPLQDMRTRMDEVNNQAFVGVGGANVAVGQGGTRYVWTGPAATPIKIGGSPSDDTELYSTCTIEQGTPTKMVPTGMTTGTTAVTLINTAGQDIPAATKFHSLVSGDIVYAENTGGVDTNGQPIYAVNMPIGMFPVTLSGSAGAAGDKTTQCAYTYSVVIHAITGATMTGGPYSPRYARPAIGKMVAATSGIGVFVGGTFTLWTCDEVPDRTGCI